ncbi:S-adenosyl-L-methionine-dependent methyltransferase [Lipomyces arxii]|uniref:S-adenosyl-L-methionine-dependent methyltransferase n=1 Tax=Lipomyces arxii TaxID=56418 RepID=UPI0034CE597F
MATDKWSADDYTTHASFVPALATEVVQMLAPKPGDKILDIGAGDGILSLAIADKCAHVHATDGSANMVAYANSRVAAGKVTNVTTEVVDAAVDIKRKISAGVYNKVFSNAAYHWILGSVTSEQQRAQAFKDVYDILPSGGEFVVECGGHGNVGEILVALVAVVKTTWAKRGAKKTTADIKSKLWPWHFATNDEIERWLVGAGFEVEVLERHYRPTTLNGGYGGMRGWIETFGFSFWDGMSAEERESAIDEAVELLIGSDWLEREQKWVAGYVRCRFKAVKK